MNIVEPYATLVNVPNRVAGLELLSSIEDYARVSHRSESQERYNMTERFITSVVLHHGDWSVTEHASATVEVYCDRGVGEEQIRHRLFSYTKESTRFVNYEKKLGFSIVYPRPHDPCPDGDWWYAMFTLESTYRKLIEKGWTPQEARSVLPLAFASKTIVTGNLRMWRHFFLMRTTRETHPQLRQIVDPLLKEFQERIPLLYDDIVPDELQRVNLTKPN